MLIDTLVVRGSFGRQVQLHSALTKCASEAFTDTVAARRCGAAVSSSTRLELDRERLQGVHTTQQKQGGADCTCAQSALPFVAAIERILGCHVATAQG